jgi:hypothetical protein
VAVPIAEVNPPRDVEADIIYCPKLRKLPEAKALISPDKEF